MSTIPGTPGLDLHTWAYHQHLVRPRETQGKKKTLVPTLGQFAISWVKQEAYLIISRFNPAVQNEMGCLREGVNSEP